MPVTTVIPSRKFGNTGRNVPILGLGTGPAGMGLDNAKAQELYGWAIDNGITYIDTAPGYDKAHEQLKPVLAHRRDEVFLATKCFAATGSEIREGLEQGLKDLGVDQIDLFYLHSMGEHDWNTITSQEGAVPALFKAKEEDLVKHVGFTAHNRPAKAAMAVEEFPFDAVMLAMNIADRYTYGFENIVLPKAAKKGMGIAAMKVFGGAEAMEYKAPTRSCFAAQGFPRPDLALRYCLSLPSVALAVVGVYSIGELKQNIEWLNISQSLSKEEQIFVDEEGARMAGTLGDHFGPVA